MVRKTFLGLFLGSLCPDHVFYAKLFERSDTGLWRNNSTLNGRDTPAAAGPGIIRPPTTITFNRIGRYSSLGGFETGFVSDWASFDGSTNAPVIFRGPQVTTSITISTRVNRVNGTPTFEWKILGRYQGVYRIEATSNFVAWLPVATFTNTSGHFTFRDAVSEPERFYRLISE